MKLMTFNTQHCMNYVTKEIDFEVMADAIKKFAPDVVALQEMRGESGDPEYDEQVEILARLTGMQYYRFGKAIDFEKGPYGNGILSKIPIVSSEVLGIPDPNPRTGKKYYETRALLKAKLEGGITVIVTHFGLNDDEQESAVKTLLGQLESEKCIFMGDLNATPDAKVLLPIRERMKDAAEGFCDTLLSCPSDLPDKKIDYIFVSPDVKVISADIPAHIASDHRPHIAEIKI